MSTCIYRAETAKGNSQFVKDLGVAAANRGFQIHNEDKMALAHTFGAHGVEVAEGFDLHMIQICKPQKAAKSLSVNPERAALMPKFVITFSKDGKTQVRMLKYGREMLTELLDDQEFPNSMEETYMSIIAAIEEAL
jgi:uncharacterized protein (DUF302 family)